MKHPLLLIFALLTIPTYSQFPVIWQERDSHLLPMALELNDETILVVNRIVNSTTYRTSSQLLHLDKNGGILSSTYYHYYITDVRKIETDKLLVLALDTAVIEGHGSGTKLCTRVYNHNLELQSADSIYSLNKRVSSFRVENSLYFYCLYIDNYPTSVELQYGRISSNGIFGETASVVSGQLKPISNFLYSPDSVLHFFTNYTGVFQLNLHTNNILLKPFSNPRFDVGYDMFWKTNNRLIIGGTVDKQNFSWEEQNRQFMIIESDLNMGIARSVVLQNSYPVNMMGINSCLAPLNNEFYFTGTKNYKHGHTLNDTCFIYVVKLTNNLEILWERSIPWLGSTYVRTITPTSSGGCIVGVSVTNQQTENADMYIIKFDGQGNYSSVAVMPYSGVVKVYPNPVKNTLYFESSTLHDRAQIEIFDLLGNEVGKMEVAANVQTFDISHVQNGVYVYRISSGSGILQSGTFIKEN